MPKFNMKKQKQKNKKGGFFGSLRKAISNKFSGNDSDSQGSVSSDEQ
jgi:hypothetical protein